MTMVDSGGGVNLLAGQVPSKRRRSMVPETEFGGVIHDRWAWCALRVNAASLCLPRVSVGGGLQDRWACCVFM